MPGFGDISEAHGGIAEVSRVRAAKSRSCAFKSEETANPHASLADSPFIKKYRLQSSTVYSRYNTLIFRRSRCVT